MKYELAVFDLDGTILNTIDDLADSCNYVLRQHNFPEHSTEEIKFMVGNGIPKLIQRALPQDVLEDVYKKVLSEFIEYYDSHCALKTRPYDGILELLKNLKSLGIKLAVNSNKLDDASKALCVQYFPGIFDMVFGNQPGVGVKPSPEGVFQIMKTLDVNRREGVVYIGDSDVDCQTAKNAEIDFIGCHWGFRGKDFLLRSGAKKIVMEPKEVLEFFRA